MATKRTTKHPHLVNWNDIPDEVSTTGHWGAKARRLTPSMPREKGHIGIERVALPPGKTYCPFHWHVLEDEVFIVLEGTGLFRYGDKLFEVKAGDTVSCPRNSGEGHQIANVSNADLVYLAIGENRSDEVCVYPDTGKIFVRSLHRLVQPKDVQYFEGEPEPPKILTAKPSKPRRRDPAG